MRNLRKLIACALIAVVVLGALAGCGEQPGGPTADAQGEPEKKEEDASDLSTYDAQLPIIDGSISAEALADAFFGSLDREGAAGLGVSFSGTERALERLSEGEIDAALIAAAPADADRIDRDEKGDFKIFELAKDAVVFAVSKNNMLEDVSSETIRDIYSGDTVNWKDAGGADVQIRAYQRPSGSELRELMNSLVMGSEDPLDELTRPRYTAEDGLVYETAGYDAATSAIGYAFWFQAAPGYESSKLLSVDGISPSLESIASGEYPLSFSYYLVVREGDLGFAGADLLAAYMRGSFVQSIIADAGYVNLNGSTAAENAKPSLEKAGDESAAAPSAEQTPFSNSKTQGPGLLTSAAASPIEWETEYQGGRKNSPNTYVSISGLADKDVQDRINAAIEELSDEYTGSNTLPSYRGIEPGSAVSEESFSKRSSIELTFAAGDIASFRAERTMTVDGFEISEIRGLTFDLRTGEELAIGDILASGADVSIPLNSVVRRYIRENMLDSADPAASVNLIAPFGGIPEDQNYYISEDGICLVIDGSNAEFDLCRNGHYSPVVITAGFDLLDGSFVGARDMNASIYEEPARRPYLFSGRGSGLQTEVIEHYSGEDSRISIKSVYAYPAGFPKKLLSRVREDVLSYLPSSSYYEEVLGSGMSELERIDFLAVSECSRIGGYYCVKQHIYTPDADTGEVFERTAYSLYDQDLEPVALKDLFAEGADCESVILKQLSSLYRSEISNKGLYTYNGEKAADLLDGLGFTLTPEGIEFVTSPIEVGKRNTVSDTLFLEFGLDFDDFGEGAMAFAPGGTEEAEEESI